MVPSDGTDKSNIWTWHKDYGDCTSMRNFRAIGPSLFMEILHLKDLGDTSVISECSLGVNLVIDNFFDVASDTLPLYKI